MQTVVRYKTKVGAVLVLVCAAASAQSASRLLVDPWTGVRWHLAADPEHPGGPGRLVPAGVGAVAAHAAPSAPLVIRAGDRLVVEESTGDLHARYAATAMMPAARGTVFVARLTFTGRPVRVVALGPGLAQLAPAIPVPAAPEVHP